MCFDKFQTYLIAVEILEAQEVLLQLSIADYPQLGDKARTRLHGEFYKKAYPKRRKVLTTKELAGLMGMKQDG